MSGKISGLLHLAIFVGVLTVLSNPCAAKSIAETPRIKVYDDQGRLISEREIKDYMISDYRIGCCLTGGILGSSICSVLGALVAISFYNYSVFEGSSGNEDEALATFLTISVVGTCASAMAGYHFGENADRRKAIQLVKIERQTGIKQPKPGFRLLPGMAIVLGAACATVLGIGVIANIGD